MLDRKLSKQHTLLVVDDDSIGREALRRGLERRGFAVIETANGYHALELLGSMQFDLILLDVEMPGIDGLEVLRVIRTIYAVTDLPVIMTTAKGESEDIVRALQLGANDYITKPLEIGVVAARVETQISLGRTAHLIAIFQAQLQDCLQHFFLVQ